MSNLNVSGPGAEIKIVNGTPPAASAAGAVVGANYTTGVDRLGANFVVLDAATGALTGGPATQTLDVKLQHSDLIGSAYVDYAPGGVAAAGAVAQITAANARKRKQIDIRGAKRFVRVSTTTGFTGGASPTMANSVEMIFGGFDVLPAQVDD